MGNCSAGHAVANGLPVVTVNRVGHEADPSRQTNGIQFWGNSFVAGPQGELLAELSNNDEEIRIVEIDKTRSENVRRWWPFFRDRRIDALVVDRTFSDMRFYNRIEPSAYEPIGAKAAFPVCDRLQAEQVY